MQSSIKISTGFYAPSMRPATAIARQQARGTPITPSRLPPVLPSRPLRPLRCALRPSRQGKKNAPEGALSAKHRVA